MNLTGFKRFWRQWHNKLLATVFISIAILFFVTYYLYLEVLTKWTFFAQSPADLWNVFVYALVYFIIIYGNIKNNDVAYSGILMFVFMLTLNCIVNVIETLQIAVAMLYNFSSYSIFTILSYFLQFGEIAVGILFYIEIQRYITHRSDNFGKLRGLGIAFCCLLFVHLVPVIVLEVISYLDEGNSSILFLIVSFSLTISEFFAGLSSLFTVERIKR